MKNIFFSLIGFALLASCASKQKVTDVTWSTFNIRYDNPGDSLNNWKYRRDSVANFVKYQNVDIVGMQEVLYSQLMDLEARLPEYEHVGVCRDDGKKVGEASPLFFKKDRFKMLDSGNFWLSQYPDSAGFVGWDGACCRIASWAKLQDKKTKKVFMAVNTHFDHVGVQARRNAALLIIERIKQIVGDKPAVLTGDFNVNDKSDAYKTITTNEFVLKDAHKIAKKVSGPKYSWHDWGEQPMQDREKIDFVFVTPSITVKNAWILQEHMIDPSKPETKWGYISDHNPVVTELEF